jgi:hypothetical protein
MDVKATWRRIMQMQLVGNLLGAVLAFCYFRFIDDHRIMEHRSLTVDVTYFVVGTVPVVKVKGRSDDVSVYRVA